MQQQGNAVHTNPDALMCWNVRNRVPSELEAFHSHQNSKVIATSQSPKR
jgi:hypothetical protein